MNTEPMTTDSPENSAEVGIDVQRLVRCLRCRAEIRDAADCPECGEVWDASADTLPTPAQLHRWAQLYWVDTPKAQEIERDLGVCFAQEIRAIADIIEDRILSPNSQRCHGVAVDHPRRLK